MVDMLLILLATENNTYLCFLVNLQVLPDGSIQKTTSRIERKIFPPKGKSVVQRPGTYKDFAANIGNIMSSTRM